MKKKIPVLLSAILVCLAFAFVASFTGVSAIEDSSETNVTTTTTTTTAKIETTTKLTWPWQKTSASSTALDISSIVSSLKDDLTSTKATTSNASETLSESGSETEKPGTTKPNSSSTAATTRKITTTVKKMTITVVMNTTVPGGTMDPLSAYYSRLSEANGYGEHETDADTTKADEQEEREQNPAVTVIIAVAAMLIAISLLTGLFSIRNKRLAQKEAALSAEDDDAFSGDVLISKNRETPEFTQTVVEDEDETVDGGEQAGEVQEEIQQGEQRHRHRLNRLRRIRLSRIRFKRKRIRRKNSKTMTARQTPKPEPRRAKITTGHPPRPTAKKGKWSTKIYSAAETTFKQFSPR